MIADEDRRPSDLSATDEMEVIFEDDLEVEEEEGTVVAVQFGPQHQSAKATRSGLKGSTVIEMPAQELEEDPDFGFEHMSFTTRKRQRTRAGRASTGARATREILIRNIIAHIFANLPDIYSVIHTYPLPPDRPHRHSYHNPLLLSFPVSAESPCAQDAIGAARKYRDALLAWFDDCSEAHSMPWRKPWIDTRPLLEAGTNPQTPAQTLRSLRPTISQRFYEVLLSEFLRQVLRENSHEQTMKNVKSYYEQWMKTFPTMEDLTKADEEEVEGLLYDKRVTRLLKAVKQICENKTTMLPNTVEELKDLPGVGPHTAGVVAAVVFGRAEPMVEMNVIRVLARQLGIRGDVNRKEIKDVIWEAARRLVEQVAWDAVESEEGAKAMSTPEGNNNGKRKKMSDGQNAVDISRRNRGPAPLGDRPGRWGQALMDLGAAVCLPAPEKPECHLCPIQSTCRAYAEGLELATNKGLVVGNETTRIEKDIRQGVIDVKDAACTLCSPPVQSMPLPRRSSDVSTKKIKQEPQDEAISITDTDPDIHYLGTVPKTLLPSTKENIQTTEKTQAVQTNKNKRTISVEFYEQNLWLRTQINEHKPSKPKPGILGLAAREFITTYCCQYPYSKSRYAIKPRPKAKKYDCRTRPSAYTALSPPLQHNVRSTAPNGNETLNLLYRAMSRIFRRYLRAGTRV